MLKQKSVRYLILLAGLFLNAFGVALIAKTSLGITPIASIPYTLSQIMPRFSLGNFTILISLLLIALQALILRRRAKPLDILLQIPISFVFGYVIDFSSFLLSGFAPVHYPARFLSMLLGCLIVACGAFLELRAGVAMLPADGFSRAIATVQNADFGTVKMITDSSQAAIALVLGLVCLGRLAGVREGTVIGALLIGNLVKLMTRLVPAAEKAAA